MSLQRIVVPVAQLTPEMEPGRRRAGGVSEVSASGYHHEVLHDEDHVVRVLTKIQRREGKARKAGRKLGPEGLARSKPHVEGPEPRPRSGAC